MDSYLGAAVRGPLAAILPHHEGLTEIRRDLHANPELGFEEHRTAALVAERMMSFGIEVHTGIGRTGVVGVIHGRASASGRSIGLCAVHTGNLGAFSVVPREAKISGTVRTFRTEVQDLVEQRWTELVESTARAFGAEGRALYERIYPATVNHPEQARFAADVAALLVGEANVIRDLVPRMGAEDFAFMLQERPGCYVRLGQGGGPSHCFLHNSRYDFNDAVIPLGAAFFAALAERRMPLATR